MILGLAVLSVELGGCCDVLCSCRNNTLLNFLFFFQIKILLYKMTEKTQACGYLLAIKTARAA